MNFYTFLVFFFYRTLKIRALYAALYVLLSNFLLWQFTQFSATCHLRQNNSKSFEMSKNVLAQKYVKLKVSYKQCVTHVVFANFFQVLWNNAVLLLLALSLSLQRQKSNWWIVRRIAWMSASVLVEANAIYISMILISNNDFSLISSDKSHLFESLSVVTTLLFFFDDSIEKIGNSLINNKMLLFMYAQLLLFFFK